MVLKSTPIQGKRLEFTISFIRAINDRYNDSHCGILTSYLIIFSHEKFRKQINKWF